MMLAGRSPVLRTGLDSKIKNLIVNLWSRLGGASHVTPFRLINGELYTLAWRVA